VHASVTPSGEPSLVLRPLRDDDEGTFRGLAREYAMDGDHRYTAGLDDFAGYRARLERAARRETLPADRVPALHLWLFHDGVALGASRLRLELNESLERFGGHIGYDVRPSERGRGFGTIILARTLVLARSSGLARVLVTCDPENHASRRVIEKNGGVPVERGVSESGRPTLRFTVETDALDDAPPGGPDPVPLTVRPVGPEDRAEVAELLERFFGGTTIVARGCAHDGGSLPGVVVRERGRLLGAALWRPDVPRAQLVAIAVTAPRRGIGRRLVAEVAEAADRHGARGLVAVTTDNHEVAQAFYRSLGFRRTAVHEGAVTEARKEHPHIPERDEHGRELRDEVEFDLRV